MEYKQLQHTQWAGWAGIAFANPIVSFLSRLAQAILIEGKQSIVSSLALASAVLKHHNSLVWFPEGDLTRTGEIMEFKPGIGMLLENSSIPIVPIYLEGTRKALPYGAFFPHLGTQITVHFGEAVTPEELTKEGQGKSVHEKIANALHDRVQKMANNAG